jgi:hypothetical protein
MFKYERKDMEEFVIKFAEKVTEMNSLANEAMKFVVDYVINNNEDSKLKAKELWEKSLHPMYSLFENDTEKVMLVDLFEEIGVDY